VDFLSNKQDVCVSIGGHGCPSNAGEKNALNPNYWGFTLNLTPLSVHGWYFAITKSRRRPVEKRGPDLTQLREKRRPILVYSFERWL
jgi:hypothetical protein